MSATGKLLLILILGSAASAFAQQPAVDSPLLDHLVGKRVLQGTAIAYAQHIRDTTNDPRLRRAAEKAIRKMNNLHVNCAC